MNDTCTAARLTMLPFDALPIYEQKPRLIFKMPRVVPDQKAKFESDELFRRLSRESEVRYTGYRDRPLEERQMRFQNSCREGHTDIAFVATGTNIQLMLNPMANGYGGDLGLNHISRDLDFDKEQGKVHIKSGFIMNGVCVRWRGWIDLERLDGVGCLEFDEDRSQLEDAILREQIDHYNQRVRDFEEKQRLYRAQQERQVEAEVEVRSRLCRFPMQNPCLSGGSIGSGGGGGVGNMGGGHHHHHHHAVDRSGHHLQMHGHGRRSHDQAVISANM